MVVFANQSVQVALQFFIKGITALFFVIEEKHEEVVNIYGGWLVDRLLQILKMMYVH